MYLVEEGEFPLDFRSLPVFIAEKLGAKWPCRPWTVVIDPDETSPPVSAGQLLLQSGVKISTILPGFEDHNALHTRELQPPRVVTGGALKFRRTEKKCTARMGARTITMKRRVAVAAGERSEAFQPLSPAVLEEENNALDTTGPMAHVELTERVNTAFSTLLMQWRPYAKYITQSLGNCRNCMRWRRRTVFWEHKPFFLNLRTMCGECQELQTPNIRYSFERIPGF